MPGQEQNAPLGSELGISHTQFARLMPAGWGTACLNVGDALRRLRSDLPDAGVEFRQKDDPQWGEHRRAHAQLCGYQVLSNKALDDFKRELARIAALDVLVRPDEGQL